MAKFNEEYAKLNPKQKEAVDAIDGPVMVVAGPGTGKTQILALRIAKILRKTDVGPSAILALTFTDAAAFNMRQRLAGFMGDEAYRVAIYTFHSFGVEIINRYPELFYHGASFLPADDATQTEVIENTFNSLDFDNPLRSEHGGKFVYLNKVKATIGYLKKAGLTPDEFKIILSENADALSFIEPIISEAFNARISKKLMPQIDKIATAITKYKPRRDLPGFFRPLSEYMAGSLLEAAEAAAAQESTAPLSDWKKRWTARDDDKSLRPADAMNMDKMEALAEIYARYAAAMSETGYYDYNDMILDVIRMLERNPGVRLDLQERYQYILVDEFQDTNNAQTRVLRLLTENPIHEGKPNIMVVGDDDQAIFKFQGAEAANILDFRKAYREPALIVLRDNYRSAREILDAARRVITKGTKRLENIIPDVRKDLTAANREIKKGDIHSGEFASRDLQYYWIAAEIKRLIGGGADPDEIAVIAREHKDLEALVPFLHAGSIPVSYERQQNVLREPLVTQLITMARFVSVLLDKNDDGDYLLPEILSYPFWNLDRLEMWRLSVRAKHERKPWIDIMIETGRRPREIAEFFIDLARKGTYAVAEEILHELMGGPQYILPSDEHDEEAAARHDMFSPFRSFYFSKENFERDRASYLRFLSSLQSFVWALREYKKGKPLKLKDMLYFVDLHLENNMAINNTSPFINFEKAVRLMSAHKAKGLEFDSVFVINCQEDVWANSYGRDLPLPKNLPIVPAGDDIDDQLRLFYVAITRAKRRLYLTSYRTDTRGRASARLSFITGDESDYMFKPKQVELEHFDTPLERIAADQWLSLLRYGKFKADEKALLAPLIERYQLNVTHLQNFLDVAEAGPAKFFEKNLLQFPEPKTPASALGSAVHKTIQRVYNYLKTGRNAPPWDEVGAWFDKFLYDERLNEHDTELMAKKGRSMLEKFYLAKRGGFSARDIVERDFKNQGVIVDGAPLAGKIDKMVFADSSISVHDFKTGRPIGRWQPADAHDKIKAWKYKMQLIFYKLLVENSRDFGGKFKVSRGVIEFVQPYRDKILDLDLEITEDDAARMRLIINAVYSKIKNLDFPDVSDYSKDIKGILRFEEDLLGRR